jgi:hypothetical protein
MLHTLSSGVPSAVVFSSSSNHRRISIMLFMSGTHRHMMVWTNQ